MRLYWLGLSSFSKFLHLALAIILLALLFLWLLPSQAQADGYRPGQAGYKDDIRETRYSAPRDDIRKYLTAEDKRQLKAIHRRAVARRDGRNVLKSRELAQYDRLKPRRVAVYYDEPVRHAERRSPPTALYVRSEGRKCQPMVKATGEERGTMARAVRSAQERWRASVIDDYGYGFADLANAIDVRTPAPAIIRYNKFGFPIYVAHIRARPCRDM